VTRVGEVLDGPAAPVFAGRDGRHQVFARGAFSHF
jgi:hypothetical protein